MTTPYWSDFVPNSTFYRILSGFHRIFATGVACRQGTLTPPDTWSSPFGTCICSTCWDKSFSELVVILPDYALRISLGTFSILLRRNQFFPVHLYCTSYTPGIQKHVTVLNTRNGDLLRSGNIKGGMFWCLHINTFEDVSTRDVHIYLEHCHNFWDNSMKFHILMWYIKLIIQFYYFGFLFLVMLPVLTN